MFSIFISIFFLLEEGEEVRRGYQGWRPQGWNYTDLICLQWQWSNSYYGKMDCMVCEGPQNVKTTGTNGPWKCWFISIHDELQISGKLNLALEKMRVLNFLIPGAQMALKMFGLFWPLGVPPAHILIQGRGKSSLLQAGIMLLWQQSGIWYIPPSHPKLIWRGRGTVCSLDGKKSAISLKANVYSTIKVQCTTY